MALERDRQCRSRPRHHQHRSRRSPFPRDRARADQRLGRPHGDRQRQPVQAAGGQCQHHAHARRRAPSISTAARRARRDHRAIRSAARAGKAAINLDLPISRRNRDFSALGNLTLNANAEVDQLSDFGTLTTLGAGANWSPVDRLNFITSWTREEGPPTINQLGDPVLDTPGHRGSSISRPGRRCWSRRSPAAIRDLQADRRNGGQARRQLAAVRQDRPPPARRLCPPDDRPPDLEHLRSTPAIEAPFPDRFVRDSTPGSWSASICGPSISTARARTRFVSASTSPSR